MQAGASSFFDALFAVQKEEYKRFFNANLHYCISCIKKIQEVENVPVVLKLSGISYYRRKNMIENRIPFIAMTLSRRRIT